MDASVKTCQIREVYDGQEKQVTARLVLEALPAWFGNPEPREDYIRSSAVQPFFAAFDGEKPVGFLCLKETGRGHGGAVRHGRFAGLAPQGAGHETVRGGKGLDG